MGVGGRHALALSPPSKDLVPTVHEAGWAPGTIWMSAENFTPPGFDPWTIHPIVSRYTN